MKTFFKILIGIGGLLMLGFIQCRRKPKTLGISEWLEKEYPNRFQVLDTYTDDIIRNLSFSVKHSIVAEKSNPLVQAKLHWHKRSADLNLSKAIVDSAFHQAYKDWQAAQTLYEVMQSKGLKNMSVSVRSGIAMILIFDEPTPENRQNSINILEKGFAEWSKEPKYDINISYMEPSEKGKFFKDIVPLVYWSQSATQFMDNMLYATFCPLPERFSAKIAARGWRFNTSSNRFKKCIEKARIAAQNWAEEHIKQPFKMLDTIEFDQSEKNTALVTLKFPFDYQSKQQTETTDFIENDGYITMDYHVEKETIGKIALKKE